MRFVGTFGIRLLALGKKAGVELAGKRSVGILRGGTKLKSVIKEV